MSEKRYRGQTRRGHEQATREKIRTGVIIDRLHKCVTGQIEMTAVQVNAARVLLNKTLPDLQAVELDAINAQQSVMVIEKPADTPATPDEWFKRHHTVQ